jgi:hypothetical protein
MPPRLGTDGKILAADIVLDGPVPVADPLPELADMLGMNNGDLLATMHRLNLLEPVVDLRADTAAYLARASRLGVGTAEFEAELERLLDVNSKRGLLGMVRRTQERYTTHMAVDGDVDKELIRISEGDTHVCDTCAELEGATGTYAEHEAIGLPGAQSCLGGDYCRCQLMPIGK